MAELADLAAWAKSPGNLIVFQAAIRRPRGRVVGMKREGGWKSEVGMKNETCKLVGRENSVRCAVREGPNSHEFGYVAIARRRWSWLS
jgi:hypothetical protein